MTQKKILSGIVFILLLMITKCKSTNSEYPAVLDKLVTNASLIFKAKILLLHTVTTTENDVSDAGVVMVTDVIEAPESFQNIAGQQVTVRFSDVSKVKVGDEMIFFTEPYWIGESIGVRELGSVGKGDELYENKEISSQIKLARIKQDDEQLRKLLEESKLVVSGQVIGINVPEGKKMLMTEHNPEWKVAEIKVDEMLKGKSETGTVKILFASSKDVMFFKSPKFKMGDEGVFIVQQSDSLTARLIQVDNMVIEPSGYIPGKASVSRIKSLIK